MSALHHEVTPTFNKAIYDSLLEVGPPLKDISHEVPPPAAAAQEVAWYLSKLDDTRTVASVRPELLVMLKKHGLSSEDPGFQQALEPLDHLTARDAVDDIAAAISVLVPGQAAQQPSSPQPAPKPRPVRQTNLRRQPQPITNPL